ncbi:MAG: hypothetical protein JXA92_12680 [candidate division Zixibacteria bacterium]|nr:hypothetical protein [candidate division Zixibacteria bacterium]
MKCEEFHEEIMLYFGQAELPVELAGHIADCESCRAFYEEMKGMAAGLGVDDDFYPNELETERFLKRLNDEIDRTRPTVVSGISWYKLVGVAASVILVVGISLLGNFFKQNGAIPESTGTNLSVLYDDDYQIALENSDLYELSDDQFYILGIDYTSKRTYDAAGQLIEDLSEEEMKYLEENFNVGDLL